MTEQKLVLTPQKAELLKWQLTNLQDNLDTALDTVPKWNIDDHLRLASVGVEQAIHFHGQLALSFVK